MKKNLWLVFIILLAAALVSGFQSAPSSTITRGEWSTVDGQETFVNPSVNIGFTLPDGYTVLSDEEVSRATNIGMDLLDLDEIDFSKLTVIYDFMTNDLTNGEGISMMFEKTYLSEENYLNATLGQLIKAGFLESDDTEYSFYSAEIAGEKFTILPVQMKKLSVTEYLCARNYDTFMLVLIFTGREMSETRFLELAGQFFAPED